MQQGHRQRDNSDAPPTGEHQGKLTIYISAATEEMQIQEYGANNLQCCCGYHITIVFFSTL